MAITENVFETASDGDSLGGGTFRVLMGTEIQGQQEFIRYFIIDATGIPVDPNHPEWRQAVNYRVQAQGNTDISGSVPAGQSQRFPSGSGTFPGLRIDGGRSWNVSIF